MNHKGRTEPIDPARFARRRFHRSGFTPFELHPLQRDRCPRSAVELTVSESKRITEAGTAALARWAEIIAGVFVRAGDDTRTARQRAQLAIASLEGALFLARTARSKAPMQNVARALIDGLA